MGLAAVLLGAFGSVFNTYAGLYLPKDNDLLLSMPIPVSVLVAAKILAEETEKMIIATKQLFYAMEVHKLLHFQNADMSAVSFAMTVY